MNYCLQSRIKCLAKKIIRFMLSSSLMGGAPLLKCKRPFMCIASFLKISRTQSMFAMTWWNYIKRNYKWWHQWGILTIKLISSRRRWRQGWKMLNKIWVVSPLFLSIQGNWQGILFFKHGVEAIQWPQDQVTRAKCVIGPELIQKSSSRICDRQE